MELNGTKQERHKFMEKKIKNKKKIEKTNAMYMLAEGQRLRQQWSTDGGMDALIKLSLQMEGMRLNSHLVYHTSSAYYSYLISSSS